MDLAKIEPATSWSSVRHASDLSHQGWQKKEENDCRNYFTINFQVYILYAVLTAQLEHTTYPYQRSLLSFRVKSRSSMPSRALHTQELYTWLRVLKERWWEERTGTARLLGSKRKLLPRAQGSGNFEIWIGPADDDDVINAPISKKKYVYITCHEN